MALEVLDRAFRRADQIVASVRADNEKSAGSFILPGLTGDGPSYPSMGSAKEQLAAFSGWQYAAIRLIAQRIAGQPICLYRKRGKDRVELDIHPVLDSLNDPNPLMVRWSMMFTTVAHLELCGRAFWWINQGQNGRLELWPVPPSWIEEPILQGRTINGWKLRPPGATQSTTIDANDMAHFNYPDPANPWHGAASPLQACASSVNNDHDIETAQRGAFRNGVNPSVMIVAGRHPDMAGAPGERTALTLEQRSQLVTAIEQRYRGTMNWGKPFIVDALIQDIKPFSIAPKEMDFAATAKLPKERITQVFGVNPIIMGQVESANRASAVVSEESFLANTVGPKIELLNQVLTAWVAARFGADLVLEIDKPVAKDSETQRDNLKLLGSFGAITKNELRQELGFDPMDGGDVVPTMPQAGANGVPSRSMGDHVGMKAASGLSAAWLSSHERAERRIYRAAHRFFTDQAKAILAEFEAAGEAATIDQFFRPAEWDEKLVTALRPAIAATMRDGADLQIRADKGGPMLDHKDQSADDDDSDEELLAALLLLGNQLFSQPYWKEINLQTRLTLERVLADVDAQLAAGASPGSTPGSSVGPAAVSPAARQAARKAAIQKALRKEARRRSLRIAKTETTGALNGGGWAVMERRKRSGVDVTKVWHATLDAVVRPAHRKLHVVQIPQGGFFDVGGYPAKYPGDPSLPPEQRLNCRCRLSTFTDGMTAVPNS